MMEYWYVERDAGGAVTGLLRYPDPGRPLDHLPEDHPDIQAWRFPPQPLAEQLNDVYNAMSVDKRVQYGPLKAAVKTFLEQPVPDLEAARLLIETATVPAEDEALRADLLDCFPPES